MNSCGFFCYLPFAVVGRRPALQQGLWKLAIAKADAAQDRLLKLLAGTELVTLQDMLELTVEPLDLTVRLESQRRVQTALDFQVDAEAVELVRLSAPTR